jgi:hypothetical protein
MVPCSLIVNQKFPEACFQSDGMLRGWRIYDNHGTMLDTQINSKKRSDDPDKECDVDMLSMELASLL